MTANYHTVDCTRQNLKVCFALVVLMFSNLWVHAQSTVDKIEALMEAYYETGQFTGVVLVADHGEVIYQQAFGYADYQDSISNAVGGKFRISSMTKQFTAMLIVQLAQEGKLDLSDRVTDHLDYYRKETGDRVTIHHLLCHESGIPNISSDPSFRQDAIRFPHEVSFLVKEWCMGDLEFEPGSKSKYCNSNYYLLGAIIEAVTGQSYEAVLKEKILQPTGMLNTGLVPDESKVDGVPTGYLWVDSTFVAEQPIAYSNLYAAGQMYSTAHDLYLWDRAIANHILLEPEWTEKVFTPYHGDHGYGWKVYQRLYEGQTDSCTTSYHAGGFEGFNSFIQRFHERDMVMIFLSNSNLGRRSTGRISDDIIYILFGLPYQLPVNKKAIQMTEMEFSPFIGTYSDSNGKDRKVSMSEGRFYYTNDKGKMYRILPEAESTFFFEVEHRSTIHFSSDGQTMTISTPTKQNVYTKL